MAYARSLDCCLWTCQALSGGGISRMCRLSNICDSILIFVTNILGVVKLDCFLWPSRALSGCVCLQSNICDSILIFVSKIWGVIKLDCCLWPSRLTWRLGVRWDGNPGETGERKERGWPSRVGVGGIPGHGDDDDDDLILFRWKFLPGLDGGWKTGWGERPGLWPGPGAGLKSQSSSKSPDDADDVWVEFEAAEDKERFLFQQSG